MPEITAWRQHKIDSLLQTASQQTNDDSKYYFLQQAHLLGGGDPLATQALAQFWQGRGELEKAIGVYQESIDNPNYIYLGNLALQSQNYVLAQNFFERASKDNKTSASLVGESAALYNLGKISDGCERAVQASKLDLGSIAAKNAVINCISLGGTSAEAIALAGPKPVSAREEAYMLINSRIYKQGEEKLIAVKVKSIGDYLVLARLAAARGDIKSAAELAEQGISLDKSNYDLNVELVRYFNILGDKQKVDIYQARLNDLNIVRSVR